VSRETQGTAVDKREDHLSGEPEPWGINRDGTPSAPPIPGSGTRRPSQMLVIKRDTVVHSRVFPHAFLGHNVPIILQKIYRIIDNSIGALYL